MRPLLLAAALALTAGAARAQEILSAEYSDPIAGGYGTQIFGGHSGDWKALEVTVKTGKRKKDKQVRRFLAPDGQNFMDIAPRLADVTGDGQPEVLVVENHVDFGARLAIYDANGFVTATEWLGRKGAWLGPVGAIDIDGDGAVEVALVDRPHVRKVLSIYRFADRHLTPVVEITPFTDHRAGDDFVSAGTRTCKGTPAFVLGNGDLSQVVEVTWSGSRPAVRGLGPYEGPDSIKRALACKKP